MSRPKPLHALASLLIVTGALAGCAATSACRIDDCSRDTTITTNVKTLIDQRLDLGPPRSIQVQTLDNVVYLHGMVGDGLERESAESVALEAPGVTQVVNSVFVAH